MAPTFRAPHPSLQISSLLQTLSLSVSLFPQRCNVSPCYFVVYCDPTVSIFFKYHFSVVTKMFIKSIHYHFLHYVVLFVSDN